MSIVLPTHFDARIAGDASRVAVAQTIDQSLEVAQHIERISFLYGTSARRALVERSFVPSLATTSAVNIQLPDWYAKLGTTRTSAELITRATDCIIDVQLYNASSGAAIGSTTTHTHTSASTQATSISSISAQEILVRIAFRRNSSSASFSCVRLLEHKLTNTDLPV